MSKQRNRTWIWLVALLIIFLIVGYSLSSPSKQEYPNFVSESPSPTGVKAFYTYLDNQDHWEVKRFKKMPNHLANDQERQLLIIVEPFFIPNSEEMNYYNQFMENGNTILLFSNNQGMFDIRTEFIYQDSTKDYISIMDQERNEYKGSLLSYSRFLPEDDAEILLHDEGGTIAFQQTVGKGQLIAVVAPNWLVNEEILKFDHVELISYIMNQVNADTILFDEYVHGAQNAATITETYPQWFVLLLLQGAILSILWLWNRGKRFGPILLHRESTVRFSDEGIRALASWYIKGKLYHDSIRIQAEYIRQMMQERWGISTTKDWTDLSDEFIRREIPLEEKEIHSFLQQLTSVLRRERISKQEYLLWSKKLERLRKEVEEG